MQLLPTSATVHFWIDALFKPLEMNEGLWGPQGVRVGFLPMSYCKAYLQLHFQLRWRRNSLVKRYHALEDLNYDSNYVLFL